MINTKEAIKKIIWAAIEDYIGVWEIPWELSSLSDSDSEKLRISKKIVELLLKRNLVKLYSCKEPYGEMIELSNFDEEMKILNDDKIWNTPKENDIGIRIGATQIGQDYYDKNEFENEKNNL